MARSSEIFIVLVICLQDGNADGCVEKDHLSMQTHFAKIITATPVSGTWLFEMLE